MSGKNKKITQIKQYSLIEQTSAYNISNANKGYLPIIVFGSGYLSVGCNGNPCQSGTDVQSADRTKCNNSIDEQGPVQNGGRT